MNSSVDAALPEKAVRANSRDRMPARLDFVQSASGLFLGLFMWFHMAFVSTILLGKDVMYTITKFFEGYYFFGKPYPAIVGTIVAFVFFIFILHAVLAMRKFPGNWREFRAYMRHKKQLAHADTSEWFVQVYTGFAMFFLGSVHLYLMLTHPGEIGPYASADRVWSNWMWPMDLLLLLAVEFHGGIGLYRLAIKWGWFDHGNPQRTRVLLVRAKWAIIGFLLALGLMTLAAYMKIGIEHADRAGERYEPTALVQPAATGFSA